MKFEDLGLSEKLLSAINDCGYDTPTPIQQQAIPLILMGRDVVGLAQTGTGKTGAFTLPMIEILEGGRAKARMPRSLILSPTRELAAQIAENFDTYGKNGRLSMALLVGGVSMAEQIKKLDRGVDVLIATPGRMLDLFERGKILLTDIKVLVIDEADRMLDMGFIPDIEKIVSKLSPMRQTLLFSATMPDEISKLTKKFLSNPKEVAVAQKSSTSKNVKQMMIWTEKHKKNEVLDTILQQEDVKTAFIFCNRKRDIGALTKWLQNHNYAAKELHGDMVQAARMNTLEDFKEGKISLLVCSDVAGRGIDVNDISHVFNYDVPFNADDYVHRIGRTGRAGNEGRTWMLATKEDVKNVDEIKKLIKMNIEEPEVEGVRQQKPSVGFSSAEGGESSSSESGAEKKDGNKDGGCSRGDRGGRSGRDGASSNRSRGGNDSSSNSSNENSSGNSRDEQKSRAEGGDGNRPPEKRDENLKKNNRNDRNKSRSENGRNNNRNKPKGRESKEETVVGFGDELPDFLKAK